MIDLTAIPDDYLPRVKYLPAVSKEEYRRRADKIAWDKDVFENGTLVHQGTPVSDFYRLSLREMVGTDSERTLTSGIIEKFVCHANIVESLCFNSLKTLLTISGFLLPFLLTSTYDSKIKAIFSLPCFAASRCRILESGSRSSARERSALTHSLPGTRSSGKKILLRP